MARGDDVNQERIFSDRDDEGEDLGGFSGAVPYDEDEDEDGGWAINKDHSDSLWDSAEETDEDDDPFCEITELQRREDDCHDTQQQMAPLFRRIEVEKIAREIGLEEADDREQNQNDARDLEELFGIHRGKGEGNTD